MTIRIIGSTGKEGKGENQFSQPRGICIDPKTKEIFIVDCNNHRVQVYHLNSLAFVRQIGKGIQGNSPGMLNNAVGICIDDSDQLYVADTNNHRISVFHRITGGHHHYIGNHGIAPGCLSSPYAVCVDLYTGILYVADYDNNRVQSFEKESGVFLKVFGNGFGNAEGQMNQPLGLCIDYEMSYLLVADFSNNRIIIFDKESGEYIKDFGSEPGPNKLSGPRGLCIHAEANILFVSDRENHRIRLYDKSTYAFIRSIGQVDDDNIAIPGILPGQFNRPMELCVDMEEGVLLVVDGYNHRIQIIEVPELQSTKQRLRAAAKRKADDILRGRTLARPSLLAVMTDVTVDNLHIMTADNKSLNLLPTLATGLSSSNNKNTNQDNNGVANIQFQSLITSSLLLPLLLTTPCISSLLYNIYIPYDDVQSLLTTISTKMNNHSNIITAISHNINNNNGEKIFDTITRVRINSSSDRNDNRINDPINKAQVNTQGDLFLSMLESLPNNSITTTTAIATDVTSIDIATEAMTTTTTSSSSFSYLLMTPALLALHSLIERGWQPTTIPTSVIGLLVNFLQNIDDGIAIESERSRVMDAIIAVLSSAITIDSISAINVMDAVIDAVDGHPSERIHCCEDNKKNCSLIITTTSNAAVTFNSTTASSSSVLLFPSLIIHSEQQSNKKEDNKAKPVHNNINIMGTSNRHYDSINNTANEYINMQKISVIASYFGLLYKVLLSSQQTLTVHNSSTTINHSFALMSSPLRASINSTNRNTTTTSPAHNRYHLHCDHLQQQHKQVALQQDILNFIFGKTFMSTLLADKSHQRSSSGSSLAMNAFNITSTPSSSASNKNSIENNDEIVIPAGLGSLLCSVICIHNIRNSNSALLTSLANTTATSNTSITTSKTKAATELRELQLQLFRDAHIYLHNVHN